MRDGSGVGGYYDGCVAFAGMYVFSFFDVHAEWAYRMVFFPWL
jgi:hypothetical protein